MSLVIDDDDLNPIPNRRDSLRSGRDRCPGRIEVRVGEETGQPYLGQLNEETEGPNLSDGTAHDGGEGVQFDGPAPVVF